MGYIVLPLLMIKEAYYILEPLRNIKSLADHNFPNKWLTIQDYFNAVILENSNGNLKLNH